ncbi:MAG: twin-arginine translocase TatA/TatE family subunit [Planctomycetota bacterium]
MPFIGSPGPTELLIVGAIALLLFGKRLPEVARNLGKSVSELKKGMSGFQEEINRAGDTPRTPALPEQDDDEPFEDLAASKYEPAPEEADEPQTTA